MELNGKFLFLVLAIIDQFIANTINFLLPLNQLLFIIIIYVLEQALKEMLS